MPTHRNTRKFVCAFHSILVALLVNATASAEPAPTGPELLAILKARDARLDNFRLNYRRLDTITLTGPETWRFNQARDDTAYSYPEIAKFAGQKRELTYHEAAIVRGPQVTFIHELDAADVAYFKTVPMGIGIPAPYGFHSNVNGKLEIYATLPSGDAGAEPGPLTSIPVEGQRDGLQEVLMEYEMAFGVSFGKHLAEIHSVVETEQGWEVEGTMVMYGIDKSVATLSIDRDYIVRSASIVWSPLPHGGGAYLTTIATTGTVQTSGIAIAESGSFKQVTYPTGEIDEHERPGEVRADVRIVFDSYRGNLSNIEYAQMVRLDVPETRPTENTPSR